MMDFVFCTDKNYLKGYGVLMLSILYYTPPLCTERLRFHILSDNLDDADKALLQGIASRRESTEVCFYEPVRALPKETLELISKSVSSMPRHITKAGYYRILAADLLPLDAHRALYLDGDVLCTSSLEDVFSMDMRDCPVAMRVVLGTARIWTYNRLGYPPKDGYFNSGVILLDLDLWRRENIARAVLDYLAANQMNDQDLINVCLHGRVAHLDFSCNVMPACFNIFYWLKNDPRSQQTQFLYKDQWPALLAGVKSPCLVHCLEALKPWHSNCNHPFAPVWRYFYAQSPWRDERLKRCKLKLPAKARIKRLGLKLLELGRKLLARVNLVAPPMSPFPNEAYEVAQGVLNKLIAEDMDSADSRQRKLHP